MRIDIPEALPLQVDEVEAPGSKGGQVKASYKDIFTWVLALQKGLRWHGLAAPCATASPSASPLTLARHPRSTMSVLGWTGFGGPAAHVGLFKKVCPSSGMAPACVHPCSSSMGKSH